MTFPFQLLTIAVFLISISSCHLHQTPDARYFDIAAAADLPLEKPSPFEWRYMHDEKPQTFSDYKKVILPSGKSCIYLLPVGEFNNLQMKALLTTRSYIEIFYQQPVKFLPGLKDDLVPLTARRIQADKHIQLLAPYILDTLLNNRLPCDGIALMAITAKDLYPKADWNFVFGLSSYVNRVGVTSIYRFQDTRDSLNYQIMLRRLNSISSHELGHMLQMRHCLHAKCVMNGSNGLRETDKTPSRLCSECQKKMSWRFKYDNFKRLKQLAAFYKSNGLENDYAVLKPELDALD
ncbi:archaemetzincin [Chitinophaga jiangningensis]|uniref:Archaemetzincin n=1 Tax=Chitinophaga jiangningensis TaxID=1419482 RepID=A0A1M7J1F3_9BACT|nr:archaemetzincin [Chitinophaga jiangningensis]SHM46748.1 archaemetzincin [Chitinophaga jiangningensis]